MKRINPKTNLPFCRGDIREDGFLFWNYKHSKIKQNGYFSEAWLSKEKFNKKIQWAKNNRSYHNEKCKEYQKTQKGKIAVKKAREKYTGSPAHIASNAKRRAAILQRTPKWLTEDDLWIIEAAYELAALRTEMLGFPWHVDHIIPLQGRNVSGLHVPANIQVIPGSDNVRKSNRYAI